MKKKLLQSVFIWIFFIPLFSQGQSQSFILYHQLKVQAEQEICRSNFEKALFYYQEAFKVVKNPFVKELYNATLCAALAKDTTQMFLLMDKCLRRGVQFSTFEKNKATFENYFELYQWSYYRENQEQLHKIYLKRVNLEYKNLLDSLDVIDQHIRKEKRLWVSSFPNSKIGVNQISKINEIDSIHAETIKGIILKYGFPTERNMGINGKTDMLYFGHVCVWHTIDKEFMILVHNAFLQGDLDVERYIAKLAYAENNQEYHYMCFDCPKNIDKNTKTQIDNARKAIGFPTFDEMNNIIDFFKRTDNPYHFIFNYAIKQTRD